MFAEFGCARVGYLAAKTCVSTDVAVKAVAEGAVAVENRPPECLRIWGFPGCSNWAATKTQIMAIWRDRVSRIAALFLLAT